MRSDRAWVRMNSGRHLDPRNLRRHECSNEDLETVLSRTYRLGGCSTSPSPLWIARHCLIVLAIRQLQEGRALAAVEREQPLIEVVQQLGLPRTTPFS